MAHHPLDSGGGGGGGHSRVPEWDGQSAGWQRYKDELRVWRLSVNLSSPYSMAARLISGLSGTARRVAIQMQEEQLLPFAYHPEQEGQMAQAQRAVDWSATNTAGVQNLLDHLSLHLQPQRVVHKGQTMNVFVRQQKALQTSRTTVSRF